MSDEQQARKPVFMVNPPITLIINDEMGLELHNFFKDYLREGRRIPSPIFAMWKQIENDLKEARVIDE